MENSPCSDSSTNRRTMKAIMKGLILIATLAAVGFAFRAVGLDHVLDEGWMDAEVRGRGALGWLMFIGVTGLTTAVGLPRQIPAFLAGYAFGVIPGTLLAVAGTGLSCAATFLYARFLGREFVRLKMGKKIGKVDTFLRQQPFAMTLVIRLLPVGNNLLTNLIAGVSSVGLFHFLFGSMLGYVPQTFIFALLGSGVSVDRGYRIAMAVGLFVVATWLGFRLYRQFRMQSVLSEENEECIPAEDDIS